MDSTRENKMGVKPVHPLLIGMSLPIMLSMLVQALYNVVDSIFVTKISENALTAVSLAFPIQNLMIAVGVGTGVGINALLSRSLGEGNKELANKTATTSMLLSAFSYLLFVAFGLIGSRLFMESMTDITEIVEYGADYLLIVTVSSVGLFFQITFERLLQATGKTLLSMISQMTGAVVNIILDPVLIFGWIGKPMGVAGAAVATVVGQVTAAIVGFILHHFYNREIRMKVKYLKPDWRVIGKIYAVGVPSIVMSSIVSVMTLFMNKILLRFSSTAVAVFGVYIKLQSFAFMPVFGLNNGMVPIIAYNYGAQKRSRIMKTILLAAIYATGIMLVGLILMQAIPKPLLKLFEASADMMEMGITCFRIISISFVFAGFSIVASSVFQALGNGILSLAVSLVRQIGILLPAAYLLALSGKLSAVWWSFPIAEGVACVLSAGFLWWILRKKLPKNFGMPDGLVQEYQTETEGQNVEVVDGDGQCD